MAKRIVDLSIAIESSLPSDPPAMIPQIDYVDHTQGAEQMKEFYPGLEKNSFPKAWAGRWNL